MHGAQFNLMFSQVCPGPDGHVHMNVVCPVDINKMPEQTLPDIQSTDHAIKIIQNRSKVRQQPFFLAVGYHKPHIPLKFPKEYLGKIYGVAINSNNTTGVLRL